MAKIDIPVTPTFRKRFSSEAKRNQRTVAAHARYVLEEYMKGNLALVNGPEMAMPSAAKASA